MSGFAMSGFLSDGFTVSCFTVSGFLSDGCTVSWFTVSGFLSDGVFRLPYFRFYVHGYDLSEYPND